VKFSQNIKKLGAILDNWFSSRKAPTLGVGDRLHFTGNGDIWETPPGCPGGVSVSVQQF